MDLAMASKLCVVSDYFPSWESGGIPSQGPPSGEMELRAALDRIVDVYVYNWDKRDGVIELHDRNWFRKRAAQIPDAWIEKWQWRNELKRTGDLGIDGLAQIALLTYDQYNQNIREVEDWHSASLAAVVAGGRAPLAFYACLHPDQRSALFSESGLDVATLSADQSEALRKLLATTGVESCPKMSARPSTASGACGAGARSTHSSSGSTAGWTTSGRFTGCFRSESPSPSHRRSRRSS